VALHRDYVKSYDLAKNDISIGRVYEVFHHSPEEMTDYYLIINDFLKVTPNHLFYKDNNWVEGSKLIIGDDLGIGEDTFKINDIQKVFTREKTYNFEVETYHNYIVKMNQDTTIVHNEACAAFKDFCMISNEEFMFTCFLGGTKIAMADDSYKLIEEICIGDNVKSFDFENDCISEGRVTEVFHHKASEMTDYYLILNEFLKVTPNHEIYVDNEWRFAGSLKVGDKLGTDDDLFEITSIKKVYEQLPSYNFEVAIYHNYFVASSEDDLLVHNLLSNNIKGQFSEQSCFLENTKVLMYNDEWKNIEEVNIGDYVKSFNLETNELENSRVYETMHHSPEEMSDYYLIINDYLKVTPNHIFYINGVWKQIGNAKIRDRLGVNNDYIEIFSIQQVFSKEKSYNLEVENNHNYIVQMTDNPLLVHNGTITPTSSEKMTIQNVIPSDPLGDGGDSPCFLKGTKIVMSDGSLKNIEKVKVGDYVKAYDEENSCYADGYVYEVLHHSPEEMTDYYLIVNNKIKITPNHQIYTENGWIEIGDMNIGDELSLDDDLKILSIEKVYEKVETFNFEVAKYHNYVVSENNDDLVVHNFYSDHGTHYITGKGDDDDDSGGGYIEDIYDCDDFDVDMGLPYYQYGGYVDTWYGESSYGLEFLLMSDISNPGSYGMLDNAKISRIVDDHIQYETVKEKLGLDKHYELNIKFIHATTGETVSWGPDVSLNNAEVIASFTRDVTIYPSTPAKQITTIFKNLSP